MVVEVPAHDLAIAEEEENQTFVESFDFVYDNILWKSWLWYISSPLNLLSIFTDLKASKSIIGTCEDDLHTLFNNELNVINLALMCIITRNQIILE